MIQSGCAVLYLLYVLIDLESKNGEPSVTKGTIEYRDKYIIIIRKNIYSLLEKNYIFFPKSVN